MAELLASLVMNVSPISIAQKMYYSTELETVDVWQPLPPTARRVIFLHPETMFDTDRDLGPPRPMVRQAAWLQSGTQIGARPLSVL